MRLTMSTVFKALAALPLLAASSLSVNAQDAGTLFPDGALAEKANNAADSGADKPHSASRQGHGHVRQGNTSTASDEFGRPYAPYGKENAAELLARALDSNQLPSWELGCQVVEPRSIDVIGPDGKTRTVWYMLFKVTNRNVQELREYRTGVVEVSKTPAPGDAESAPSIEDTGLKTDGPGEVAGGAMLKPSFLQPVVVETGQMQGMPVSTSLSLLVETISGFDALAGMEDDLLAMVTAEVDRKIGTGLSSAEAEGGESGEALRQRMISEAYAKARRTYRDAADAELRRMIAVKEGLMEWRGTSFEPALWSSDSFKRDISPVYELSQVDYEGALALPMVAEKLVGEGVVEVTHRWPVVNDSDGTLYAFLADGEARPEGTSVVKEGHDLYGKLLPVRYQEYDVVDRAGRRLAPGQPGYHAARAAGGEILRDKPDHGIEGNLTGLLETPVKRPKFRVYREGDRVLKGWDTGVPTSPGSADTYRINGKLVDASGAAQRAVASVLAELRAHQRGAGGSPEVGADLVAAAERSMAEAAVELSSGTEIFEGRAAVSSEGVPVKQLDHLGRAIRRTTLTYRVGERVTEAEYRAWAQRFSPEVLSRHDQSPWTRPLRHDDLLVGLPKIKMGKLLNPEHGEPEMVLANGRPVPTGRIYDSTKIAPEHFMRDPDGEYFTNRTAPLPDAANAEPGAAYVYAPYGAANADATPVPAFDSYGVWADYTDPVSGRRIPLRNADGSPVLDEMGQPLFVKEFEYECLYAYEYERVMEDDPGFAAAHSGTVNGLKKATMKAFFRGTTFVGPATWQVWSGSGENRKLERLTLDDPGTGDTVSPEQYGEANGLEIKDVEVPAYVLEKLREGLAAKSGQVPVEAITAEAFSRSSVSFDNGWTPGSTPATSQRWTLPAPLVAGSGQDMQILSSSKKEIAPGEFVHDYSISERWGVYILPDVAPDWDFMNVTIRGLRSPVIRRGFSENAFKLPAPGITGEVRRTGLDPVLVRQDWAYTVRFKREGNAAKPSTNNVHRVSEGWRLMGERPVE